MAPSASASQWGAEEPGGDWETDGHGPPSTVTGGTNDAPMRAPSQRLILDNTSQGEVTDARYVAHALMDISTWLVNRSLLGTGYLSKQSQSELATAVSAVVDSALNSSWGVTELVDGPGDLTHRVYDIAHHLVNTEVEIARLALLYTRAPVAAAPAPGTATGRHGRPGRR